MIDGLITSGVAHIIREQSADGSFQSLSSEDKDNFDGALHYSTTFFTSTILNCLHTVLYGDDQLKTMRECAVQFLIEQKSSAWSWNYWAREAKEYTSLPYPDDLDDTFAALSALIQHNPTLIDGPALASMTQLLTSLEIAAGGPYRTWIVRAQAGRKWQDVDVVVNSTIGYFLSLQDIHLPRLKDYIETIIQKDAITSPYYPSPLHVAYFIGRFYKSLGKNVGNDAVKKKLAKLVLNELANKAHPPSPLEKAMAITSLINLGRKENIAAEQIDSLIKIIKKDGWRPYAFCMDPVRHGKKYYAGSAALTAAFCVEALVLYQTMPVRLEQSPSPLSFHMHIQNLARNECAALPTELSTVALKEIDKTTDARTSGLARTFLKALGPRGKDLKNNTLELISLASLYGWMAYTIYDDFLDGEGDPLLLPAAHFFLRMLTRIYSELAQRIPGALNLFNSVLNIVDAANIWEQRHCRDTNRPPSFGNHANLADRSFGHGLGPLVILLSMSYPEHSEEFTTISRFFRHYLIARQLHDDAHDWASDLAHGRINSVGALVLCEQQHSHSSTDIAHLRALFWNGVINNVLRLVQDHITHARWERDRSTLLRDTHFMEDELLALEKASERTLSERDRAAAFLKSYLV